MYRKGLSTGKAFVEYIDDDHAKKAIEDLNGVELDKRELNVEASGEYYQDGKPTTPTKQSIRPKPPGKSRIHDDDSDYYKKNDKKRRKLDDKDDSSAKCPSVYVGNLSYQLDDQGLEDFAYKIGKIKDCYIERDRDGRSKGFGIVEFKYYQDASKAIDKLNGMDLDGR